MSPETWSGSDKDKAVPAALKCSKDAALYPSRTAFMFVSSTSRTLVRAHLHTRMDMPDFQDHSLLYSLRVPFQIPYFHLIRGYSFRCSLKVHLIIVRWFPADRTLYSGSFYYPDNRYLSPPSLSLGRFSNPDMNTFPQLTRTQAMLLTIKANIFKVGR